jgi:hypothetical protein
MRTIAMTGATMIVTLLLVSASSAIAAPPSDACSMLTNDQVSAALGGSVGAGKALANGVCQWAQAGKPGAVLLKLDVTLLTPEHFARLKSVTMGTVTKVDGLGDEAFYSYSTFTQNHTTLTVLYVRKGSAAVSIRVSGGTKPAEEYQVKEKAIAGLLVVKM